MLIKIICDALPGYPIKLFYIYSLAFAKTVIRLTNNYRRVYVYVFVGLNYDISEYICVYNELVAN